MSMDYPRGWQLAKATPIAEHDPKCSFAQTGGAILCDCHVLTAHSEYNDDTLQGLDGVPCDEGWRPARRC